MKKAVQVCFLGFVFLFAGCVTGGGQGIPISVDDENVFHSYVYPKMEVRIAKDIKYIDTVPQDKYEVKPENVGAFHEKMSVKSNSYSFLNPYDPELGCVKVVSIEIKIFETDHSSWIPVEYKKIPGIIDHGSSQIGGKYYQYGVVLNNFSLASIKNDLLKEANLKIGYSGPMKMMTKIYTRVLGADGSGVVNILYSESIPKSLEWHTSSPLTDERRVFLEAFNKRCEQNLVIIN